MHSTWYFRPGPAWIIWLQQTVLILIALVLYLPAAPAWG